uniref:Uncharacterized protein n=1 Tax=Oryzias latipes TaxID=8090 RepID=A0A3B3HK97_ORYLA
MESSVQSTVCLFSCLLQHNNSTTQIPQRHLWIQRVKHPQYTTSSFLSLLLGNVRPLLTLVKL